MPIVEIQSLQQLLPLVNAPKVTVVDFYATWCGPCKAVAPEYERLSGAYDGGKVVFCKVDVDRVQECAQRYNVTAMPTFVVFRSGEVVESIRGANMQRLTQVVDYAVSKVQAAFSGQGRSLGGSGQSTLLANNAVQPSSTVLDPMGNAVCKLISAAKEGNQVLQKDACDAIYTLVKQEAPLGVALLPILMSTNAFDPTAIGALFGYIETLPSPDRDDGTVMVWSLVQMFVTSFTTQSWTDCQNAQLHKALHNFVRCPAVRAALVRSSRFLGPVSANGCDMELHTLLGAALSVSDRPTRSQHHAVIQVARQQRIMQLLQQFPMDLEPQQQGPAAQLDGRKRDKAVSEMQLLNEACAALCFPIIRELLSDKDTTRQPTLQWIGKMLAANADYTKTMMDNARVSSVNTMVHLTHVLVDLALPVVSGTSFEPSSIPTHYLYDPKARIGFGKEVERIAHFDAEHPLPELPQDEGSRSYLPRVDLFFGAIRAIGLTSTSMLLKYDSYARNVQHPSVRAQDRHYFLAECASIRAHLGNPSTATKMIRFLNGVARWLLHVIGVGKDGSLPAKVSTAWTTLPQCIVDDVIRGTKLVTTLKVAVDAAEMHDIIALMLVLMGNSVFFPKPHTHALFPPYLTALMSSRDGSVVLQRHPWFHGNIVRGCILCYIAMEKSAYEKVQTRYELSHCLREFLKDRSLCAPVSQEFEGGNSSVLERFSHMVTADVNAAVDSIVATLQKMNAMSSNKGSPVNDGAQQRTPSSPPQRSSRNNNNDNNNNNNQTNDGDDDEGEQDNEDRRSYDDYGRELSSNIMLFDVSVDVFIEMTLRFPRGVGQNLVAQQISQMLARSITTFTGSKCRDLVIKDAEKYSFHPRQILTKLVECLVQFQGSDTFLRHLCECGVPLQEIYDAMGSIVHRQLVREDLIGRLTAMYNAVRAVAKQVEEEVEIWADAPDFALDALLSTPLTDPVAIPTEVKDMADLVVTNRATLHHSLLTEQKNPYTNEYLDESLVTAFNERADVAEAIKGLKVRIEEWLSGARLAFQEKRK